MLDTEIWRATTIRYLYTEKNNNNNYRKHFINQKNNLTAKTTKNRPYVQRGSFYISHQTSYEE